MCCCGENRSIGCFADTGDIKDEARGNLRAGRLRAP
jgi:hypothetical protein